MKRTLAIALVTIGLLGGGVAVAAPSQAKTPKAWMTVSEFHKIKRGMTLAKVRSIIGAKGRLSYSYQWTSGGYCDTYDPDYTYCLVYLPLKTNTGTTYSWRTGKYSTTGGSISFENGRVTTKSFWRL